MQSFDICIKQLGKMALTLQKIQSFDICSNVKLMTLLNFQTYAHLSIKKEYPILGSRFS